MESFFAHKDFKNEWHDENLTLQKGTCLTEEGSAPYSPTALTNTASQAQAAGNREKNLFNLWNLLESCQGALVIGIIGFV